MKLIKIRLENYRGVKDPVTIACNDFNVIVGRNDAGKSTVLKALDIFLNDKNPITDDLNVFAENKNIRIDLFFNPCNCEIVIDENANTSFEN